jgi:hypothetical protein
VTSKLTFFLTVSSPFSSLQFFLRENALPAEVWRKKRKKQNFQFNFFCKDFIAAADEWADGRSRHNGAINYSWLAGAGVVKRSWRYKNPYLAPPCLQALRPVLETIELSSS